jgi:hypothetical protein
MQTAVLKSANPAEVVHTLMQLRCRQEILERWLASEVLTDGLRESLHGMLAEVEDQLRSLAAALSN